MTRERRHWTSEEDNALRTAVNLALSQSRPLLWRELAKSVPNRSNKDCRRRWCNSLVEGTSKGPWTEDEDRRLVDAVQKHGSNWAVVAKAVTSRTPDQCSGHWSQVLDPNINYADWTVQEDQQLLHAVLTHGTNWATIATTHSPQRHSLALKNRYSRLRRESRTLSTSDQDRPARKGTHAATASDSKATQSRPRKRQRGGEFSSRATNASEEYDDDDDDDDEDNDDSESEHGEEQSSGYTSRYSQSSRSFPELERPASNAENSSDYALVLPAQNEMGFDLSPSAHFDDRHHFHSPWMNEKQADGYTNEQPFRVTPLPVATDVDGARALGTAFDPQLAFGDYTLNGAENIGTDMLYDISVPPSEDGSGGLAHKTQSSPPLNVEFDENFIRTLAAAKPTDGGRAGRYRVSIDLVCEGQQLQHVVAGLTNGGTITSVQINPDI